MAQDRAGRGRRPTLDDVAGRAGVSRALASMVLRDIPGASAATAERIRAAAEALGYRPDTRARLLAQHRSRLLGVVFGLEHGFHAELVDGLYTEADAAGYELVLSGLTPNRDARRAVETLLDYRCEALLLLGPEHTPMPRSGVGGPEGPEDAGPWLAELAARVPVIAVGHRVRVPGVDSVHTADGQGMRLAVDHLVDLGHERIAHVDGGSGLIAVDRRRGFRAALRRHGHAEHALVVPGGKTEVAGATAAAALLAGEPPPTAVVAYNDDCALGLLDACAKAGVDVPGELSVVGYDDTRLARLGLVDLTTVGQDMRGLARLSVERADARLAGAPDPGGDAVLAPRLVIRGTTGPAPAAARSGPEDAPPPRRSEPA